MSSVPPSGPSAEIRERARSLVFSAFKVLEGILEAYRARIAEPRGADAEKLEAVREIGRTLHEATKAALPVVGDEETSSREEFLKRVGAVVGRCDALLGAARDAGLTLSEETEERRKAYVGSRAILGTWSGLSGVGLRLASMGKGETTPEGMARDAGALTDLMAEIFEAVQGSVPDFPEAEKFLGEFRSGIERTTGLSARVEAKFLSDFSAELRALPASLLSLDPETVAGLVSRAVARAKAAFLAGEDRGGFFAEVELGEKTEAAKRERLKRAGFLSDLYAGSAELRAALDSKTKRAAFFSRLEDVARMLPATASAFARLVAAGAERNIPELALWRSRPDPWKTRDGRALALALFVGSAREAFAEGRFRGAFSKSPGISPATAGAAEDRVRDGLIAEIGKWSSEPETIAALCAPFGETAPTEPQEPGEKEKRAFVELFSPSLRFAVAAGQSLRERLIRRLGELIAEASSVATREEDSSRVAIPSAVDVPLLFVAGGSLDRISPMKEERDGSLKGVTLELRAKRGEGSSQLTLLDPDFFTGERFRKNLDIQEWRGEVLKTLPRLLGPEALALYYATFAAAQEDGAFPYSASWFLDLFGMADDTRNRRLMDYRTELLTRVEMKLVRKFGPSSGGLEEARSEFPLIEKSAERLTLKFRDRPRLSVSHYRHPRAMMEIRREYHVRLPKDAFRVIGEFSPGRGSNDAGYRALALVATAYVNARAFASRKRGKQGDARYLGPDGYELPLSEIVVSSGFTTPTNFRQHPTEETERAIAAIERLRDDFRLFGPGTTVKGGSTFRFEPTDALRRDLSGIAESASVKEAASLIAQEAGGGRRGRRRRRGRRA